MPVAKQLGSDLQESTRLQIPIVEGNEPVSGDIGLALSQCGNTPAAEEDYSLGVDSSRSFEPRPLGVRFG